MATKAPPIGGERLGATRAILLGTLSAMTPGGTFSLPVFLNGVIGHAFLVGVPSAVFARLGRGESRKDGP